MYKRASKSRATQRQVQLESHRGPKLRHYLVVAFRVGADNHGRRRVYRRVWTETFEDEAFSRCYWLPDSYKYRCVADDKEVLLSEGDQAVVGEWVATRRGVNRNVHWLWGSRYMSRENDRAADKALPEANTLAKRLHEMGRLGKRQA